MDVTWRDIPVARLAPAPWNYKEDDAAMSRRLEGSLARNGQVVNLIVRRMRKGWEVVNGNHRLEALVKTAAPSARCCDLGRVSQETAMRIAAETNELEFEDDPLRLSDVLGRLVAKYSMSDLVATLPFSGRALELQAALGTFDLSQLETVPPFDGSAFRGADLVQISIRQEDRKLLQEAMRRTGLPEEGTILALLAAAGFAPSASPA